MGSAALNSSGNGLPIAALPPIPGGWKQQHIALPEYALRLTLPANPDAFLDRDAQLPMPDDADYLPYWGCLWPSAEDLAVELASHAFSPGTSALEIGCGIGLCGLAALTRGMEVTFSDYDLLALQLALYNAGQNGFPHARGLLLDWRHGDALGDQQWDLVFGSDVIYARREHQQLLTFLERAVACGGQAWLADPLRPFADLFVEAAQNRGWNCRRERRPASEILILRR